MSAGDNLGLSFDSYEGWDHASVFSPFVPGAKKQVRPLRGIGKNGGYLDSNEFRSPVNNRSHCRFSAGVSGNLQARSARNLRAVRFFAGAQRSLGPHAGLSSLQLAELLSNSGVNPAN